MKDTAIDYKKLYEQSLLTISEKEEQLTRSNLAISEKDEKIASLSFELDKFRKYIFGKKGEKFSTLKPGVGQMDIFELGTTRAQQEALSNEVAAVEKPEGKNPKKRARHHHR